MGPERDLCADRSGRLRLHARDRPACRLRQGPMRRPRPGNRRDWRARHRSSGCRPTRRRRGSNVQRLCPWRQGGVRGDDFRVCGGWELGGLSAIWPTDAEPGVTPTRPARRCRVAHLFFAVVLQRVFGTVLQLWADTRLAGMGKSTEDRVKSSTVALIYERFIHDIKEDTEFGGSDFAERLENALKNRVTDPIGLRKAMFPQPDER